MKKKQPKDSAFVTMSIRFRKDIHAKIEALARANNRTIAGQLAELIQKEK